MDSIKITKKSFYIKNSHGDLMAADIRYPDTESKLPLIIFCHGFKGFKDWGGFPYMADKLAAAGNFVLSFNFSYNGTGEKPEEQSEFTRLDLFAKNTFSREQDDLQSVIDYAVNNKEGFGFDKNKIYLIGHSRGGGAVILKAGEDRRIKKLVTLASVNRFNRYNESMLKKWKEAGYIESLNTRTNQLMRMDYTLVEDLIANPEKLDIQQAVSELKIPYLIIHGMQDLSVDYSDAEDLYARSSKDLTELFLLEYTGHTFGIEHPFKGTTIAFDEVIKCIVDFLGDNNKSN